MTYGYDANAVNLDEFLGKVSKNGTKQHAQNLLEALASRRSGDRSYNVALHVTRLGLQAKISPASNHLCLS